MRRKLTNWGKQTSGLGSAESAIATDDDSALPWLMAGDETNSQLTAINYPYLKQHNSFQLYLYYDRMVFYAQSLSIVLLFTVSP